MNKEHLAKAPQAATATTSHGGILRPLATSQMREVQGGGLRLRVPIGLTDTGDPIYDESDGSEVASDAARIWKPVG